MTEDDQKCPNCGNEEDFVDLRFVPASIVDAEPDDPNSWLRTFLCEDCGSFLVKSLTQPILENQQERVAGKMYGANLASREEVKEALDMNEEQVNKVIERWA